MQKNGELSRTGINILLIVLIIAVIGIIWFVIKGGIDNENQEAFNNSENSENSNNIFSGKTEAIIADHNAARDFDKIPRCWIEEAKKRLRVAYQHTSHGSQISSGIEYLKNNVDSSLYAFGDPGVNELYFADYAMGGGDLGGDWAPPTRDYLDENSETNTIMWSWCGQVSGYNTYESMSNHYLEPAEEIVLNYDINFVYMTGHLEGTGPEGDAYTANNIIRQHVKDVNGILFDFADIESYDPEGKYYPNGSDACEWCEDWCEKHPSDCLNLPECAHSHGFNCVQKGKAFWWMMARMAGWDGTSSDKCP